MSAWAETASHRPDSKTQTLVDWLHQWAVTVYLTNEQSEVKQDKDSAWVFQPELIVETPDQSPIFLKRAQQRDPAKISLEEQAMQMVYRKQVEFAVGHGVAVHADLPPGGWERAVRLSTRVMPACKVPHPHRGRYSRPGQYCSGHENTLRHRRRRFQFPGL